MSAVRAQGGRGLVVSAAGAVAWLEAVVLLAFLASPPSDAQDELRVLVSVTEQIVRAPFPARATLHLHNAGPKPLWLYRRVRHEASQGAWLVVRLDPVALPAATRIVSPARGRVFETVGLPRPRLVRLAPGEDGEERVTIGLEPATIETDGGTEPLWGRYRLSVIYGARYPNGEQIRRNIGISPWQGEVSSNAPEIELLPPSGEGSVSGSVMDSQGRPVPGARVSLTDRDERLVGQLVTEPTGNFAFTDLPYGLYWVTARRDDGTVDTATFRHVTLTPESPHGSIEIFLLPQPTLEAKQFLHKPVLFQVTDAAGEPAGRVIVESLWSIGTVLDTAKAQVDEYGVAAMELIPGNNFVTLKKRGCADEEYRVEVEKGDGIDAFKLRLECRRL